MNDTTKTVIKQTSPLRVVLRQYENLENFYMPKSSGLTERQFFQGSLS